MRHATTAVPVGYDDPIFNRTMKLLCLAILACARNLTAQCVPSDLSPQQTQEKFRKLDRKAQVEFRHAQFAQASEDFRQGACSAPDTMRPYYALYGTSVDALAKGDFNRAREVLQEADRLRPDYPLPLAMLIKINLIAGDIDRLKNSLLDAAHRFPRDYKLHAEMAQDLLHEQKNDLALAEALRSAAGGTPNATATVNLAVLEHQAGASSDAARLSSSLEEQEALPRTLRASAAAVAGLSYESSGQLQVAVRHLKLAIQLDPKAEQPYLALARIYTTQENKPAAIDVLREARSQTGDSPSVLLALGSALVAAEQYQSAREVLARMVEEFPNQLEAYPKLAESERNLGEPTRATETLQRLAKRKPDHPMIHTAIAQSLMDEGIVDYPKVFRELDLSEKTTPEDYDVHYLRGKAYLATGEFERAVRSLQRAVELRPEEPRAYYKLGLAYRKLGNADLAKRQFERLEFLKGTR
jgi:tetratricopeptide (TPR) repeat protein